MRLAILMTCHNRKKSTLNCLGSVYNYKSSREFIIEVFLVDDGSIDGTALAVKKKFPSVNVIMGNGELFWNRGMHLAWRTAAKTRNYDFYLWLNDDTLLNETALEILLQTSLQKESQSIIVGATSSMNNIKKVTYGGRSHKKGLLSPEKEPIECDYFNGNIVLIPNLVYNKVGTNDPIFHHALGDFDYGLRAARLGIKSYIAPGFLGRCDVHETLLTWCNPNKSFKQRWKAFRSPLGNNPEEFFVFRKRHKGFLKAIVNYFTNHLRVVFPSLWKKQ